MGRVKRPFAESGRIDDLLKEVSEFIGAEQPELSARIYKDMVVVEGKLLVGPSGSWFDVYDILLVFLPDFPRTEPIVWEVGSRIPKTVDRHVFPKDLNCCLGIWEEWLIRAPSHRVSDFMNGPLQSYFESQTFFETQGGWPYGQRSHGQQGVLESYSDVLGIEPEYGVVRTYLEALARSQLKGHHLCPCGSGLRLRQCHFEKLTYLAEQVGSEMARRMLNGLSAKLSG